MASAGAYARYWRLRLQRALQRPGTDLPDLQQPVEFRVGIEDAPDVVFHVRLDDRTLRVDDGHTPPEFRATLVWAREVDLSTGRGWRIYGDRSAVVGLLNAARTPVKSESWLSVRMPPAE